MSTQARKRKLRDGILTALLRGRACVISAGEMSEVEVCFGQSIDVDKADCVQGSIPRSIQQRFQERGTGVRLIMG